MKTRLADNKIITRLNEIYNGKYDLSQVNYIDRNSKLTLICPVHGPWSKMAQKILYKNERKIGCPKCSYINSVKNRTHNRLKTTDQFIIQAKQKHGNIYDYSLVNYINTDTKIKIICPSHGIFEQLPWGHLKHGCRSCNIHKSKIEKEWLKSFSNDNIIFQYRLPELQIIVDGFDPKTNIVYEFYGDFWHGNPKKFNQHKINTRTPKQKTFGELYLKTLDREKNIKEAGYQLISIWENDYVSRLQKSSHGKQIHCGVSSLLMVSAA